MESAESSPGIDAKATSEGAAVSTGLVDETEGGRAAAEANVLSGSRPARPVVEILSELLADRDLPCPMCQYNLRGCRQSTCPECGSPLGLTIGTPRVIRWPWLPFVALLVFGIEQATWTLYVGWSLLMTWDLSDSPVSLAFLAPGVGVIIGVMFVLPSAFRGARRNGADQRRLHRAVSRALVVGILVATTHILQFLIGVFFFFF